MIMINNKIVLGYIGNGKSTNRYHLPFVLQRKDKFIVKTIYNPHIHHDVWDKIEGINYTENQDDIFQVYARNTGLFKDSYHITFFKEKLYNMIEPLCQEKKYIKKYEIDISGNLSETKWTGKEDIDEYIKKEEYTIEPMIYLENNQTDEQYAEIISDWLMTLSKLECSMRVLVKIEDLNIVIFDEEFESGEKNMNEYTEELLKEEINNTRKNSNTIKEYKKCKQENKK